jgi:hypothetical protein
MDCGRERERGRERREHGTGLAMIARGAEKDVAIGHVARAM